MSNGRQPSRLQAHCKSISGPASVANHLVRTRMVPRTRGKGHGHEQGRARDCAILNALCSWTRIMGPSNFSVLSYRASLRSLRSVHSPGRQLRPTPPRSVAYRTRTNWKKTSLSGIIFIGQRAATRHRRSDIRYRREKSSSWLHMYIEAPIGAMPSFGYIRFAR